MTLPEEVCDADGTTVTFKYDPFGRRIYKSSSSGTSVYDNNGNIDEPLAILRSSATNYFHADGLGSVTSLSNAAGSIANTYTFSSVQGSSRSPRKSYWRS